LWNNCYEVANKTQACCKDLSIGTTRMATCFSALVSGIVGGIVGYLAFKLINKVADVIINIVESVAK
jgi:hypothetical protein